MDGYGRNSTLGGSTILNSTTNIVAGRDDSSGSEDNTESQSVQFYLGNAPPAPMINATSSASITPRTPIQAPFEVLNHVTNHNHTNHNTAATAAAIAAAAAVTGQQQQQHTATNNQDRYLVSYNV